MFDWLRNRRKGSPPAPPPSDDAVDWRQDVVEQAHRDVRAGYRTIDDIREGIVEVFQGSADEDELRLLATAIIDDERRALQREQQGWPIVTDYDRLEAAFGALNAAGIVACQDFTCCGTCGNAEIDDEIDRAEKAGVSVRGYTFFHWQDTESAVDGHGLYLNYGGVDGGEDVGIAIGQEIVAVLRRSGLAPDWNERWETRIHVPLNWQRRP